MKWLTHQTGAIASCLVLGLPVASIGAAFAGSVFPDVIDQCISRLGPTKKVRQKIFNRIHRGSSHWFGWWLVCFIFTLIFIPASIIQDFLAGFMLGALSHVVLDMLTPVGIPLLPFTRKNKLSMNLCTTGHFSEHIFLVLFIALCVFMEKDALIKILGAF